MTLPFAITLAHCSHRIPKGIRPSLALTEGAVRESVDLGTEELFGTLPAKAILRAPWSRLVVDLNRSSRERGSRGVIAKVDYHGRTVYGAGGFPSEEEIEARLEAYYWPYHRRLEETLADPEILGLLDCHSLDSIGPARAPDTGKRRKDIVLGNNGDLQGGPVSHKGPVSCPREILWLSREHLRKAGFSVSLNAPYSGGYIVAKYGHELVLKGRIALQIEINQALYLEPGSQEPVGERLADIRNRLLKAFGDLARDLDHCLLPR